MTFKLRCTGSTQQVKISNRLCKYIINEKNRQMALMKTSSQFCNTSPLFLISKKWIKLLVSFGKHFIDPQQLTSLAHFVTILNDLAYCATYHHLLPAVSTLSHPPVNIICQVVDCFLTPNHGVPGILSMIINIFLVIKLDKLAICHTKK